jgi:hypothetical protein
MHDFSTQYYISTNAFSNNNNFSKKYVGRKYKTVETVSVRNPIAVRTVSVRNPKTQKERFQYELPKQYKRTISEKNTKNNRNKLGTIYQNSRNNFSKK